MGFALKVRFAPDSSLEGDGFEPSVPLYILTVSDPLFVGSVTVPFANTEITLSRPGTERSKPASAAEWTGQPPGGFPLARYRRRRGSGDLRPSAYGRPRAMWCAPATIADGMEEFLEVKYLCIGGTDRSLTGL